MTLQHLALQAKKGDSRCFKRPHLSYVFIFNRQELKEIGVDGRRYSPKLFANDIIATDWEYTA